MKVAMSKLLELLLCAFFAIANAQDAPLATTSLGSIKGSLMTTRLNKTISAFRGIRYAKAPVGDRRFKVPEPIDKWDGVFDASEEGPSCIRPSGRNLSEDCLALNIYTTNLNSSTKKSVVVFFPPGGFTGYSAQSYLWGPQYFLDQNIVLVTVNYRLSALGFISTGDHHAPGNLGLKDQVVALKFIRDHISNFGGDPNAVTITGYSAGGWSVVLHMLSPMSTGLFHQAVAMSGSPFKPKLLDSNMTNIAKQQASFVNCTTDDLDQMFECLMKVPAQEFGNTLSKFNEFYGDPILIFAPVVEPKIEGVERFLHAQPVDIIRSGNFNHVPLITGITKDEIVGTVVRQIENSRKGNNSYFEELNAEWERIAPISFQYDRTGEQSLNASREIRKFYFRDEPISVNNSLNLAQIYADAIVGWPNHRLVNLMAKYNTKHVRQYAFIYQARYSHQTFSDGTPFGVAHHDDLIYVYYISYAFPFFNATDPETQMVEKMTAIWGNYANTGEPIPKDNPLFANVTWDVFTPNDHKYLEIVNTFSPPKIDLFAERFALWDKLFPLPEYKDPGKFE